MLVWCAIKFIICVKSEHYGLKAEEGHKCDVNHISEEIGEVTRSIPVLCVRQGDLKKYVQGFFRRQTCVQHGGTK